MVFQLKKEKGSQSKGWIWSLHHGVEGKQKGGLEFQAWGLGVFELNLWAKNSISVTGYVMWILQPITAF